MSSRATNPTGSRQLQDDDSGDASADAEQASGDQTEAETEREPVELSLDTIFEILKNQRRRYVLKYLREAEGTVQLNELADQVAAWENDKAVGLVSSNERKRVYVGLYQCHLTKMDDSEVIDFDQYRGTIEVRPAVERLYEYLDFGEKSDDASEPAWDRYYTGIAAAGVALGAAGLAIPGVPIGLLGFLLTAVVATAVVGVTAAAEVHGEDFSFDAVPARFAADDEA
jgi:hypothetical protein